MPFVADLHVHSHHSISTSPQLDPEHLELAARTKGVTVVGTGDFTHPAWRAELAEKLEPREPGLYGLRQELRLGQPAPDQGMRFLLTAEVSGIYRYDGRVRKVHNLVLVPDLAAAERIGLALARIGNVAADGRPVLALDSRDLLEIVLECSAEGLLIPAHIWTPWFSVLGAKSGFDSIAACYRDLAPHIRAVETGLSSDPPMNWMSSALDRYTLVSNSDAHSPDKLGREANILDTELSYAAVTRALRQGAAAGFRGTIEFFPEEGKYHFDGHRACGVRQDPAATRATGGRCPVCGKEVTVGVLHRVLELADQPEGRRPASAPDFHSLIPLREVLAEIAGQGTQSKSVGRAYESVISACGTELDVLLRLGLDEIEHRSGELLAEAIRRMRARDVLAEPGYDGEYGSIRLFRPGEIAERSQFFLLSGMEKPEARSPGRARGPLASPAAAGQGELFDAFRAVERPGLSSALTPEQLDPALHGAGPALVVAGPGTGKTRILTWRVAHLITALGIRADRILVVTFTNRAAGEIRERLVSLLGPAAAGRVRAGTFHAFGLAVLTEHAGRWGRTAGFTLYDERDREELLSELQGGKRSAVREIARTLGAAKQGARPLDPEVQATLEAYEAALRARDAFDLDDLVSLPASILGSVPHGIEWLLVDELQDANPAQYHMIRALMPSPTANLFAIGDPDQAIYGFRGGDPSLASRLVADYPTARSYGLTKSHRCPRILLRASSRVLRGSTARGLEGIEEGPKVRVVSTPTDKSEAELIARSIEGMMGGLRFFSMDSAITQGVADEWVRGLSDFAVLVRIGRVGDAIRAAFDNHAIPYQHVGERSFLEEEPCRSIVGLLWLSADPANTRLKRRVEEGARARRAGGPGAALEALRAAPDVAAGIARAAEWLEIAGERERADVDRLLAMASPFGPDLSGFLRLTRLGSPGDGLERRADRVPIMTLHAAKGLEFPCVFIAGCEDGLIPYALPEGGAADEEEERRLLYVGMTRASRLLVLTHARKRQLFGRSLALPRSRFLMDLDAESFEETEQAIRRSSSRAQTQLELEL